MQYPLKEKKEMGIGHDLMWQTAYTAPTDLPGCMICDFWSLVWSGGFGGGQEVADKN